MREPAAVRWLVVSAALSVVLTVLVNVAVRVFPDAADRVARRIADLTSATADGPAHDRETRVFVPWKAMIAASLILTVVVNVVLWIL